MSCPGLWLGVGLKEMWMLGTLVTIVTPPFIQLAAADVDSWSPFPLTSSLPVSTEPLSHPPQLRAFPQAFVHG